MTPTDCPRARQLKGRKRGGLHHDHAARRCRFFATWAPRQCCDEPTTAALRRSCSQDHRTHGRCCGRRGSYRFEEAGVAAIATRCVSASVDYAAASCESVLHLSIWCTTLARPSAAVMGRLGRGRRAFILGCTGGARRAMRQVFSTQHGSSQLPDGNACCCMCARPGCT